VRGGGMAVRNIACLPALVGAWRQPAGGIQLSSSASFPTNRPALQRPDLLAGRTPRTINMTTIGDDLLRESAPDFGPKIEAVIVYNANPLAIAPDSRKVQQGFEREDLFTVVLEHFHTDSADYADILLPATTQLEHVDAHLAYGHLYMMANNAAVEPVGESKPNTEFFRLLAARMGFTDPCFQESDDAIAAQAFNSKDTRAVHFDWESLKRTGWSKLNMPDAPFATYIPPYESVASNPELAKTYPLAMISPPARNFLNSTFVNVQSLRATEGEPHLDIHPLDAAARGIAHGDMARIYNDRGSFLARARVTDKARAGLVVGLSIWWKKLATDGKNANEVTSQRLTDMGRAPTFYDTLVQVEKAAPPTRDDAL
jgi:anaerobic selenocysteine-containing dehydrogenase